MVFMAQVFKTKIWTTFYDPQRKIPQLQLSKSFCLASSYFNTKDSLFCQQLLLFSTFQINLENSIVRMHDDQTVRNCVKFHS